MGILLSSMALHPKQVLKLQSLTRSSPIQSAKTGMFQRGSLQFKLVTSRKGNDPFSVSYLNHSLFQEFLSCVKEEFGFNCPMDGLIIPCKEDAFNDLTSQLHAF
ncbi:hypothetical protein VitviT2T_005402 [Vitis vinifera]|uniref:Auxin-responsive protein SAUR23 n=2 Tax=Vitis vinifera TaxID=29760 RepID=A0A438BYJ1_VITVI|nr:Auxin-responsive protein SAUR23 [Vitis vinifera]RVX07418.1 Auxin-responsive protein SAUR23 [Vitis vinifera]WJZ85891.1 hypothetical protein VitviT2T_005402 [Vitis vinifera]